MTQSPSQNLAGHVLGGRYTLLSLIAKGGMGEVWRTRDQLTGHLLAAKVLRPELSGEELPLSRLRLEAQNALRIEHPNIASVLDSGEDDGRGWIVMELVEGRPLTDYLRGGQRITPPNLIPILIQISMALGAASAAGVVHRDIKPANILIRPDGMVKITDFGISRTADQVDLTQVGMVMGTAQYLSPEQALGEPATTAGDVYAIGVIAYEAAAGRRPFTGKTQVDIAFAHVNESVPPLPDDVPEPLSNIIFHLLEKDPDERPASGRALMRELMAAAQQLKVGIAPLPLPEPTVAKPTPSRSASQPSVAPVRHTPKHQLPEKLLRPVDMNVEVPPASSQGKVVAETVAPPLHAAPRHKAEPKVEPAKVPPVAPSAPQTPAFAPPQAPPSHRRPPLKPVTPSVISSPDAPAAGPQTSSTPTPQLRTSLRARSSHVAHASSVKSQRAAHGTADPRRHWRTVSIDSVMSVQDTSFVPAATQYNRSRTAPPLSFKERLARWVVLFLIALTLLLIGVAIVHNRFGSLSSLVSSGAQLSQEVKTWSTP